MINPNSKSEKAKVQELKNIDNNGSNENEYKSSNQNQGQENSNNKNNKIVKNIDNNTNDDIKDDNFVIIDYCSFFEELKGDSSDDLMDEKSIYETKNHNFKEKKDNFYCINED